MHHFKTHNKIQNLIKLVPFQTVTYAVKQLRCLHIASQVLANPEFEKCTGEEGHAMIIRYTLHMKWFAGLSVTIATPQYGLC